MGCFLGCFGFSSTRKRRKPANRVQPGDHRFISYEPLDSASTNLDIAREPITKDSESSKRPKETLNCKIRKKVSFNLNVQTYEPIPKQAEESTNLFWGCDNDDDDDDGKKEEISKEIAEECPSKSLSEEDSAAAKMASYPSNYRYRNCIESYDEEDEIAYEESDLDDDDEDDDDGDNFDEDDNTGGDIDNLRRISQNDFSEKFRSLSLSSQTRDSLTEENLRPLGDLKSVGMNQNVRDRSQYVHSVLNPVENLSQWKAVKAELTRQRKENVATLQQQAQQMKEFAVDASLSNWIVSTDSCESRTSSIETISVKKSSLDRTFPWRSRDDMPILDITNLEI